MTTELVLQKNFDTNLQKMNPEFIKLLGDKEKALRLARIVQTEVKRNPKLLACNHASLFGCILDGFRNNLEIGGAMGHAYLIPYKEDVTFQIGYKGWIEMARRSGQIKSLNAYPIYKKEVDEGKFEMNYGENYVKHEPILFSDAGECVGWWAKAVLDNGESVIHFMSIADIMKRKARAMTKNIWNDWEKEMQKKTILKAICKTLPLSIEDQRIASKDEHVIENLEGDFKFPEAINEVEAINVDSSKIDAPEEKKKGENPVDDLFDK